MTSRILTEIAADGVLIKFSKWKSIHQNTNHWILVVTYLCLHGLQIKRVYYILSIQTRNASN